MALLFIHQSFCVRRQLGYKRGGEGLDDDSFGGIARVDGAVTLIHQ